MWKPLLALAVLTACNQASAPSLDRSEQTRLTFAGYDCTDDCSGHEAGYEWAEAKGASHEDDCIDAESDSFREGCLAYVADTADSSESDYDPR